MAVRLGEIMVSLNLLRPEQVEAILEEQTRRHRPFGELAERMFGLTEQDVEMAWTRQYAALAERVDPRKFPRDERTMGLVERRQAWQFRILPLRRDGAEVMVATVEEHLTRAMRFALRSLSEPCYFVLADPQRLGEALCERYPLAGMTPAHVAAERTRAPWSDAA
jgi:hypothetical protein